MGRPGIERKARREAVGRPGIEREGLTVKARREAGGKARYREARGGASCLQLHEAAQVGPLLLLKKLKLF